MYAPRRREGWFQNLKANKFQCDDQFTTNQTIAPDAPGIGFQNRNIPYYKRNLPEDPLKVRYSISQGPAVLRLDTVAGSSSACADSPHLPEGHRELFRESLDGARLSRRSETAWPPGPPVGLPNKVGECVV